MAKALTIKAIENAKPGAARREIPDALVPGLRLVVQPSGARSWAVRYRHQGAPAKLTLGPLLLLDSGAEEPPAVLGAPATLTGARSLARAALADVAAGRNPAAEKRQAKALATDADRVTRNRFSTCAELFVRRYAQRTAKSERSWEETARLLGLVVDPDPANKETDRKKRPLKPRKGGLLERWGKRQVQDIGKADVIELLDRLVDGGSPIGANRTLAAVRKLFNWCIERGILDSNPCAGVKAPTPERSRDRVLSDAELALVWRGCDAIGEPFGPLVKVLLLTGQRREEVAAMRWSELDLDAATWTLPRSRTKNNEPHSVPLAPTVVDLLRKRKRIGRAGYVFTTTGETHVTGYSRAAARLDKAIQEVLRADAGRKAVEPMPDWRWHDLRRTLASGMARLGVAVHVVEAVLNHKTGTIRGVAAVYNRYSYDAEKRRALEAWAAHVLAVVDDQPVANNVTPIRAAK